MASNKAMQADGRSAAQPLIAKALDRETPTENLSAGRAVVGVQISPVPETSALVSAGGCRRRPDSSKCRTEITEIPAG